MNILKLNTMTVNNTNRQTNTKSKDEIIKEIAKVCKNSGTELSQITNEDKKIILEAINKLDQNLGGFFTRKTHTESTVMIWVLLFKHFNKGKEPINLNQLKIFSENFLDNSGYKFNNGYDWGRNKNQTYFNNICNYLKGDKNIESKTRHNISKIVQGFNFKIFTPLKTSCYTTIELKQHLDSPVEGFNFYAWKAHSFHIYSPQKYRINLDMEGISKFKLKEIITYLIKQFEDSTINKNNILGFKFYYKLLDNFDNLDELLSKKSHTIFNNQFTIYISEEANNIEVMELMQKIDKHLLEIIPATAYPTEEHMYYDTPIKDLRFISTRNETENCYGQKLNKNFNKDHAIIIFNNLNKAFNNIGVAEKSFEDSSFINDKESRINGLRFRMSLQSKEEKEKCKYFWQMLKKSISANNLHKIKYFTICLSNAFQLSFKNLGIAESCYAESYYKEAMIDDPCYDGKYLHKK